MSKSDNWLASIDLNAVVPPKGTKGTKAKKPKSRVVYRDSGHFAPSNTVYKAAQGPDIQRGVREVVGRFVPVDEIVSPALTVDQVDMLLDLIATTEHALNHPVLARASVVLKAASASHETRLDAERRRLAALARQRAEAIAEKRNVPVEDI